MALTYFKRYRMEIALRGRTTLTPRLPEGYRLHEWDDALLALHASAKYESFRTEIDANVFPCLGEHEGCYRLMDEIQSKEGFLPEATWLLSYQMAPGEPLEYCGTVQGIQDRSGYGSIQNLGITPSHRGLGLGSSLLDVALSGFWKAGLRKAYLEVTAQNEGAIRLYQRLGFRSVRTVYKAVEVSCPIG